MSLEMLLRGITNIWGLVRLDPTHSWSSELNTGHSPFVRCPKHWYVPHPDTLTHGKGGCRVPGTICK